MPSLASAVSRLRAASARRLRTSASAGALLLPALLLAFSAARGEEVGVYRVSPEARDVLVAMQADVRHGRIDGDLEARLTKEQVESLERDGFRVQQLYASPAEQDRALRSQPQFDQFHTYDQIRADFYSAAAAHPEIARLVVLGHSVQGREILALRITDAPGTSEDEPKLAFWGGIHGDEYAGGELPYRYALYLCDSYGLDPAVTRYVDENEIWCIPMINPDGRVLGRRTNANGVDVNRDFGYEWSGEGGSPAPFSQVESRAQREFCAEHAITLSTTFHCSGDVVFYPWGYAPQDVPDHGEIVDLSRRYAAAASYAYGNSWHDYETHGELLDDLYGSRGGICLTVEVSNSASSLPQTIARNQAGMNLLCDLAGEGIGGLVSDAVTGDPIPASVWISGNPVPSYTDPGAGDLHRVVPPGTYDLVVRANGHLTATVSGVVVADGAPGTFQVALEPGGGEYAFRIVSVNQRDPNHVHANLTFPSAALGAPDGIACSLGSAGMIVLDMGEGHEIVDAPGTDLEVVEAITPADPDPEGYRVYVGDAYTQNTLVGSAVGTAQFDLAAAGVTSTRYLRILDNSGANPNGPLAGMDLDAVVANIHGVSAVAWRTDAIGGPVRPSHLLVAPNPVRTDASIRFMLPVPSPIELAIFDAAGRRVGAAIRTAWLDAGVHELPLDASRWEIGRYFYRIRTDGSSASGTFTIVR
jgi:carboxypeptidase T